MESSLDTQVRIARIVEATDEANEWSTSPEMYGKYADAILADFIVIPRAQIPHMTFNAKSTTDTFTTHGDAGPMSEPATMAPDAATAWQMVYHWVSIALNVELMEAEDAARDKRRDELAAELAPRGDGLGDNWYANVSDGLRRAIDRIIELENRP